jgi:acetyl esterase/lipase
MIGGSRLRIERHRYGDKRSQYGELYLPDGDGPFPVAVVIHGGFWRARYGRKLMTPVSRDLASRGWAAWNIEYRRLGRLSGGGWPCTFDDVAAAVDMLADLPALDLSRVVAIGHSAGGHLATWVAARPSLDAEPRVRVTAAVAQAGVLDLRHAWELRLSDGVVRQFLGGTPDELPDRYAIASPIELLPAGVPVLLVHGGRDETVPPVISERYLAAAREADDECELVLLADEDHYGHIDPASPLWKAVLEWLA